MIKSESRFSEEEIARFEEKLSEVKRERYNEKGRENLPYKRDAAQEIEQEQKFEIMRAELKSIELRFPVPEHLEVRETFHAGKGGAETKRKYRLQQLKSRINNSNLSK